MLYVKIMSKQDIPDEYTTKAYIILSIGPKDRLHFGYMDNHGLNPSDQRKVFVVRDGAEYFETYEIHGNVYVMNEAGKTISTYTAPADPIG